MLMDDEVYSLSEEDIKLRYITPAIMEKGWSVKDITMETKVKLTDGKINLRGNLVARGKAKYAVSYNDLNAELVTAQDELSNLISDLTGDEYAIRGLNEFKNSLKG